MFAVVGMVLRGGGVRVVVGVVALRVHMCLLVCACVVGGAVRGGLRAGSSVLRALALC